MTLPAGTKIVHKSKPSVPVGNVIKLRGDFKTWATVYSFEVRILKHHNAHA
jgi:hypothetical protein